MTAKKAVLSLFTFLLLVFLANAANAQEDFTAATLPSVELCPCSNQGYAVTVQNTGSVASSYAVVASGDAAGWVTFNPNRFVLNPSQSGNFFAYVNSVCNIKGSYNLEILITTNNGLTKAIKQTLKISECYDYSLQEGNAVDTAEEVAYAQHQGTYNLCTDEKKSIPILITNSENFANEYSFFLDAPEWAGLNVGKARLDAKQSGIFLINYDSSGILGKFDFNLAAISSLGKVQRKKSIEADVEKCYDLEATPEKKEDTICSGEQTIINVEIKNSGAIKQRISVEADGAEWAGFGNSTNFDIGKDEIKNAALILSPKEDASGKFAIAVSAIPDNKTAFTAPAAINVDVINKAACYEAGISTKAAVTNLYKEDFFFAKITNNGIKKAVYSARLEGPSWAGIEPQTLELNPGQTGNLNVRINPSSDIEPNAYGVKIILESNGAIYSKDIDIKLRKETELEKNLKAGLKAYQYYLYLSVLIIILILVFIKPIIRTKNKIKIRYEKYRIRRERLKELKLAREKKREEKEKQRRQEEKARERQIKKEARKTKRKENQFFKKHKAWAYSIIALIILVFAGHYFKLYNLKYTNIYLRNIFVGYLYYILIGIGIAAVLFLLALLYNYLGKRKKKAKKPAKEKIKTGEKKAEKKIKKEKRWYNKPAYIGIILALLIALITSAAYFGLLKQAKDFVVLYSYYFGLGIIILIIIIGILSFYKPAIKLFKE
ncbi:hypothetical protein HYU09_05045 [Candidatus Woesearchaeota archaeon]|nr:hypothetical protein [Candidatus Woesearchaeota archaeon]